MFIVTVCLAVPVITDAEADVPSFVATSPDVCAALYCVYTNIPAPTMKTADTAAIHHFKYFFFFICFFPIPSHYLSTVLFFFIFLCNFLFFPDIHDSNSHICDSIYSSLHLPY